MATLRHPNPVEVDVAQDPDLMSLLQPAQAFDRPADVLNDPDLTRNEKRAILASWASDACAVEAAPELRSHAGSKAVPFDEVVDALRQLDQPTSPAMRRLNRSNIFSRRARAIMGRTMPRPPEPPQPDRVA